MMQQRGVYLQPPVAQAWARHLKSVFGSLACFENLLLKAWEEGHLRGGLNCIACGDVSDECRVGSFVWLLLCWLLLIPPPMQLLQFQGICYGIFDNVQRRPPLLLHTQIFHPIAVFSLQLILGSRK